ncbi:2-methylpropanoate--CoA ligase CCL4-like [Magnolia sinica]|uniref:2-methylpropanoate--CoA ligase CCL4-like n=1 Tax=Magnolia sinica TaxID=86752 RepID=UPI002659E941|nr:2-methylpropanoate--CoA ligase CCL4-like [Magnolia sinica]
MDSLKPGAANSSPLTPMGFLDRAATIYGSRPSMVYNDMVHTWSQTHQRCIKLASTISSMGIGRGHVVSVVAPNIPAMYEMHFAVPMCGAVLNTINIRLDSRTIAALLLHSEAKLVFVDFQSWSLVKDAVGKLEKPPRLILIEDEFEEGGRCLPSSSPPSPDDQLTYEMLVEKGNPGFRWVRPESDWSPAILNYTSGTTSSPKGVVHCHRGLFTMAISALIEWTVPKQPTYLWTLPMFHANGWSFPWGIAAMGGTNVFVRRFDAATIYAMIIKHGVTHMCAAPVVLNMLANAPESIRQQLPHTVHIMTGGAPPPASVLFRIEALGFTVTHAYGLTETVGPVLYCTWKAEWDLLPAAERAKLKARQGVQALCMDEVDVIDGEMGESVKRDGMTLGEIVLRGSSIQLGYLKDAEMTSKSLRNGWFYTGDVGVMHPDGYIEIKDRSKDVIISGGENMSSVEVESVLYSHPAINEAAVVARPDEFWGESPCVFVSLKEDYQKAEKRVSEKEIIGFCRERLPHYMVPKTVVFEEELPKTSTGKIQKFLLRDKARKLGSSSSTVSRM